jgi:hypothetical protein
MPTGESFGSPSAADIDDNDSAGVGQSLAFKWNDIDVCIVVGCKSVHKHAHHAAVKQGANKMVNQALRIPLENTWKSSARLRYQVQKCWPRATDGRTQARTKIIAFASRQTNLNGIVFLPLPQCLSFNIDGPLI